MAGDEIVGPMPQDHVPETWTGDPRLAMVTDDGSLTVRSVGAIPADDGDPIVLADGLAEQLRFSWPCWSPDGDALLVSATGHDAEGGQRLEIRRVAPEGDVDPIAIFQNDSDSPGMIAPSIPHYMCWSPSGRMAAVVAQSRKGLMLHLVDATRSLQAQSLMAGGPLYFSWAPDSKALAIHLGMELLLFDTAASGQTDASGSTRIARDNPTFRSPVWTLEGDAFLYTTPNTSDGVTLWRSTRDGESREALLPVNGMSTLVRAPQTDLIAVTPLAGQGPLSREVMIVDANTGTSQTVTSGPVTALSWAPDGSALFYVSPIGGEADLTLLRLDLKTGQRRPLAQFRPSGEFATLLGFFDQFAHSHSLVSPDGRWIAFSGLLAGENNGGGRKGTSPQNNCYVVSTSGTQAPRWMGAGEFGVFPPAPIVAAEQDAPGPLT
jgi:Tol biopolymer transport system component